MARGRKSKSRSRKSSRKARKSIRRARGKRCWSGGSHQLVFPAPVENASYESSFSSPSKMMLSQGNEYQSLHAGQHGGAVAMNLAPAPPGYTGVLEDGLRGQAAITPIDQSLKSIVGMSDQAGGARRRRRGTKRSKRSKRGTKRGRKLMGGANSQKASSAGSANTRKASTPAAANLKKLAATAQANLSKLAASQAKPSINPGNVSKLAATAQTNLSKLSSVVQANLGKLTTAIGQGGGAAVSLANAQNFGAPGMLLSPGQEAAALGGMNPEWKLAMDPASFAPNLSK